MTTPSLDRLRRLRLLIATVVALAVIAAGTAFPTSPSTARRACANPATDGYVVRSPYLDAKQEAALQGVGALDRRPADLPRTYHLHVPAGLKRKPVPLLVTMHGLGGSGGQHAEKSELQVTADRHGIFASGHSNGGFMTHRLACDAADLFAAGASIAAGDVEAGLQGGPCQPTGRLGLSKWLGRYQCSATPVATNVDAFGSTETYSGCTRPDAAARPSFVVAFRTLDEHNHGWGNGCAGSPTCDPAVSPGA